MNPMAKAAAEPERAALSAQARSLFGPLPAEMSSEQNPVTEAKIELGRVLYYDPRFSKSQQFSCNSCHPLAQYGADGEKTSLGHGGRRGERNSPSVYNAALHVAQFWDGRAADVEEQAKGPVLNPVEMAMPSEEAVLTVIESCPGYAPLFRAAFPGSSDPIRYDNMARAIGAFERRLVTPSRFDDFIQGDLDALTPEELQGLQQFISVGCVSCHQGPGVGGSLYRKLGLINPYPTQDKGRFAVTGEPADLAVFKVPSLRNAAKTGPYFHDGSIASLPEAVRLMGWHQLGQKLSDEQVKQIAAFIGSLTGRIDEGYIAKPELPASGPKTPKPDPS